MVRDQAGNPLPATLAGGAEMPASAWRITPKACGRSREPSERRKHGGSKAASRPAVRCCAVCATVSRFAVEGCQPARVAGRSGGGGAGGRGAFAGGAGGARRGGVGGVRACPVWGCAVGRAGAGFGSGGGPFVFGRGRCGVGLLPR